MSTTDTISSQYTKHGKYMEYPTLWADFKRHNTKSGTEVVLVDVYPN